MLAAVAIDLAIVADQLAALDQPALDRSKLLPGVERVGLAGSRCEERPGERRGSPVEHLRRGVELRARAEHVGAVAALAAHDEVSLPRRVHR
jgi:hypothetical protein